MEWMKIYSRLEFFILHVRRRQPSINIYLFWKPFISNGSFSN